MNKQKPRDDDPIPSLGTVDPLARLAAAVVVKACEDAASPDPLTSLDALAWLNCEAGTWLNALGFDVENYQIFTLFLGGFRRVENFRRTEESGQEYDSPRTRKTRQRVRSLGI